MGHTIKQFLPLVSLEKTHILFYSLLRLVQCLATPYDGLVGVHTMDYERVLYIKVVCLGMSSFLKAIAIGIVFIRGKVESDPAKTLVGLRTNPALIKDGKQRGYCPMVYHKWVPVGIRYLCLWHSSLSRLSHHVGCLLLITTLHSILIGLVLFGRDGVLHLRHRSARFCRAVLPLHRASKLILHPEFLYLLAALHVGHFPAVYLSPSLRHGVFRHIDRSILLLCPLDKLLLVEALTFPVSSLVGLFIGDVAVDHITWLEFYLSVVNLRILDVVPMLVE